MTMWRRFKQVALIGLCTMALAACGNNDDEGDGNFQGDRQPTISHNGPLSFSNVTIGESETKTLRIQNTGDAPLNLEGIELVEGTEDRDQELLVGDNWTDSATIEPESHRDFDIIYKPVNPTPDTGYIKFDHNDPAAGSEETKGESLEIDIQLPGLEPDISGTDQINFASVEENTKAWKLATIQNTGDAPLEIAGVKLGDNEKFYLTFPDPDAEGNGDGEGNKDGDGEGTNTDTDIVPDERNQWPIEGVPQVLEPNETMDVRIWFEPTDTTAENTELQIVSNDPDEQFYKISISGNAGTACLGLSHEDEMNFGQSSTNQVNTETMTVENCRPRAQELEIQNVRLKDDGGGVFDIKESSLPGDLADGGTYKIIGDDRTSFTVTFTPPEKKSYQGTLVIESNDPSRRNHEVKLIGKGSDNECPSAIAEAKVKGSNRTDTQINTLPLETIQFSSKNSQDPDGQIDRYEWSILKKPEDSTARLVPAADRANPTMFLDLAGTYEVELVVYDDDGAASCGNQAIVTIEAIPNEDIHVQLVWDTPSDTDQTDSNGTDVDLHYLSPKGTWNEAPYDIFWHNKTADWGTPNDKSDDPSLDIDDTNGAGPENVNHDNPKPGQAYKVGVYYYEDNGFGPSYATVRIYIDGKLKREFKNKFLEKTYDFWFVGLVEWPTKNIYKRDKKTEGFPGSSGNP